MKVSILIKIPENRKPNIEFQISLVSNKHIGNICNVKHNKQCAFWPGEFAVLRHKGEYEKKQAGSDSYEHGNIQVCVQG